MLYKIKEQAEVFEKLEPVEFKDFSSFGKLEKDLENLIADSILDVLFEDARLMPVFQERQWQAEADIYALNENGELVIFELKRSSAGKDATTLGLACKLRTNRAGFYFISNYLTRVRQLPVLAKD